VRLLDGALAPLPCVSLRYYGHCSCPDEATCPLRDVMIDVRDAMLEILDRETLAELAARTGQASIDPRGRHADALAGRRP
jgi:DNA-binding IscR family transcriptional regulator